ncbi:hypothetical protein LV75_000350 [Actinokineospora diospyrosa]|uniref:Uncharacterized protein n=1 Tax=Actinokineospora diospyrosa TaxID=103728 RepID=A0ABT1I5G2_9PSEU|nr:hypothetical protein [Actinokineospora diospyrosa]
MSPPHRAPSTSDFLVPMGRVGTVAAGSQRQASPSRAGTAAAVSRTGVRRCWLEGVRAFVRGDCSERRLQFAVGEVAASGWQAGPWQVLVRRWSCRARLIVPAGGWLPGWWQEVVVPSPRWGGATSAVVGAYLPLRTYLVTADVAETRSGFLVTPASGPPGAVRRTRRPRRDRLARGRTPAALRDLLAGARMVPVRACGVHRCRGSCCCTTTTCSPRCAPLVAMQQVDGRRGWPTPNPLCQHRNRWSTSTH